MKTLILVLSAILINLGIYGQTLTIGTGTDPQPSPFNLYGGYARSAAIYTSSELSGSKFITALAWQVAAGDIEFCPIKIYLTHTSDDALYSTAWSDLTTGATLVYDAPASFPATGWKTIDIADFAYVSTSGQNLLVLCEANYGGNGAPSNPVFAYTYGYTLFQHETWQLYETPPTDPGAPDENRPNIQISYISLTTPNPPSGFMAQTASATQINLTWKKNAVNNDVMVAYNTVNTFGTPAGNYVAGNAITGGGTVLYNGSAASYNHNTGLNPATTYYYKAWSVLPSVPTYSYGSSSSATTLCVAISGFPDTTDFESQDFPPVCWSIAQKPWGRSGSVSAYGIGAGSAYADFFNYNIPSGTAFDLVSPTLDLSTMSSPAVSFDHAYATYSGGVDILELWSSSNDGASYSLLTTWLGGSSGPLNTGGTTTSIFIPNASQWASKSYLLPVGTNKVLFRGVSALGNNLYLDNIIIGETTITWNGSVSNAWDNPLNWTPNIIPVATQNVSIPSGKPNNPVVTTSGNACKNLQISTGASFTVSLGSVLTVMENVTIQNGAVMTNNGSLVIKGNLVNQN